MIIEPICRVCGNINGCQILTVKELSEIALQYKACIVIDERNK